MQGQGRGSHGIHGMQGQGRGMPGRGLGRGAGPPRGQLNTYSEVKVRVGPVPVEWPFPRVKDALFQIAQEDVAYVGKTAADGMVIPSYRDGATAEAAVRALAGKTLVGLELVHILQHLPLLVPGTRDACNLRVEYCDDVVFLHHIALSGDVLIKVKSRTNACSTETRKSIWTTSSATWKTPSPQNS